MTTAGRERTTAGEPALGQVADRVDRVGGALLEVHRHRGDGGVAPGRREIDHEVGGGHVGHRLVAVGHGVDLQCRVRRVPDAAPAAVGAGEHVDVHGGGGGHVVHRDAGLAIGQGRHVVDEHRRGEGTGHIEVGDDGGVDAGGDLDTRRGDGDRTPALPVGQLHRHVIGAGGKLQTRRHVLIHETGQRAGTVHLHIDGEGIVQSDVLAGDAVDDVDGGSPLSSCAGSADAPVAPCKNVAGRERAAGPGPTARLQRELLHESSDEELELSSGGRPPCPCPCRSARRWRRSRRCRR